MNVFVCLSAGPWSSEATRAQQLLARFRDAEVLFFEPAHTARPRGHLEPGRQVRPNITVYTLPPNPYPAVRTPILRAHRRKKNAAFLAERLRRHGARDVVFWITSPDYADIADELPRRGLVYDCDRFWPEESAAGEGRLAAAADVVFAVSPGLMARLAPFNSNVVFLPNGVNFPMFSRPKPDMAPLRGGPLFGLSQPIGARTDLAPLLYAADVHPDWRFLLLGRAEGRTLSSLAQRVKGLIVPSPLLPLERPDFLAQCDAHLLLLHEDAWQGDIIPTYIYEALSTGRPIVSMLWPDQVEEFPDVIYGADSAEVFSRLCEKALMESPGWVSDRRRNYGRAAAWSERSAQAAQILQNIDLY